MKSRLEQDLRKQYGENVDIFFIPCENLTHEEINKIVAEGGRHCNGRNIQEIINSIGKTTSPHSDVDSYFNKKKTVEDSGIETMFKDKGVENIIMSEKDNPENFELLKKIYSMNNPEMLVKIKTLSTHRHHEVVEIISKLKSEEILDYWLNNGNASLEDVARVFGVTKEVILSKLK